MHSYLFFGCLRHCFCNGGKPNLPTDFSKTLCNDVTLLTTVDLLEVELASRAQEDEEERRKQKSAGTAIASVSFTQNGNGKGKPKPFRRGRDKVTVALHGLLYPALACLSRLCFTDRVNDTCTLGSHQH